METVVRTARTVEEAEELALKELGADRNEVEVEILSRGKAGFLGIGAEVARVRVTRLAPGGAEPEEVTETEERVSESPEETAPVTIAAPSTAEAVDGEAVAGAAAAEAVDGEAVAGAATAEAVDGEAVAGAAAEAVDGEAVAGAALPGTGEGTVAGLGLAALNNILTTAGVNVACTVRVANDPDVGGPIIDLTGADSGLLIGRRGQTLQSLQFIVNLIVRKEFGEGSRVVLDVERYRQRRESSLRDMANKVAERVSQTGRSITLEPMSAADRRIIHISLAENEGVSTESIGFGEERKVTILPKR